MKSSNFITIKKILSLFWLLIFLFFQGFAQEKESFYPIKPVRFTEVEVTDSFWKERMETNREVTIPIAFKRSEESGRIKNFRVAAELEEGTYNTGRGYDDSDVYKVMEGAAYSLRQHPDPELEKYLDDLIEVVGKAQEDDGYLFTVKTILGVSDKHIDAKKPRWVEIEEGSHELYNVGHMYEAAVAHYNATGKKTFLDIAIKNADLIDKEFGWGKREIVPGHQEIEIGLAKLYEATAEKRYLDLAKFFLDKRGENEHKTTYNQSHKKVVEQDKAVGHSVRAVYMYAAMADMAALTGDKAYIHAMDKLWHDIVDTKLYIIGGIGAAGGHEGFGDHYELPNLRAYNETCAGIANVFWNYRLFLTHGDAKYMDVLERSLYNNVLSGVSLDGDTFFYPNRLESHGNSVRSEWFGTSCCPSNVSRFLPDVPGYIYAKDEQNIYVNLFISSTSEFEINSQKLEIAQTSGLPWSGNVQITVNPEKDIDFSLRIRLPGWAGERPVPSELYSFKEPRIEATRIRVNGDDVKYDLEKGYAIVKRQWSPNDQVTINFPFEVRTIKSNDKIVSNKGRVALQAGPMVYCVEGFDVKDGNATNLLLNKNQEYDLVFEKDELGGIMTLQGEALELVETEGHSIDKVITPFKAIPYYAWANRGGSEMLVWIPAQEEFAVPKWYPTIASKSKVETSKKEWLRDLNAVNDLRSPGNDKTGEVVAFHWWPEQKKTGTITYTFYKPERISESTVYWFKSNDGGVLYPKSWKLYYLNNGQWKPIKAKYPVNDDGQPSRATFKAVSADGFKLELKMGKKPAGLYEWELN